MRMHRFNVNFLARFFFFWQVSCTSTLACNSLCGLQVAINVQKTIPAPKHRAIAALKAKGGIQKSNPNESNTGLCVHVVCVCALVGRYRLGAAVFVNVGC